MACDRMVDEAAQTRHGNCHCGAVRFEVHLPRGFRHARRCTCSMCRMRGAIAVSVSKEDLKIVDGAKSLTSYRFNTGQAEHFFCSVCGIYTHHQRRFNPRQFAVNVACLENVSPFDFAEVGVIDGVNHPNDNDGSFRTIGTLRFELSS